MARRISRSYKRKIRRRAILIIVLVVLTVVLSWLMWHPHGDTAADPVSGEVPPGLPSD